MEKKRAQEHKSARHKGNCELVRWEVRGLDGDIAYFVMDILDKLSLRAMGWTLCRVRVAYCSPVEARHLLECML